MVGEDAAGGGEIEIPSIREKAESVAQETDASQETGASQEADASQETDIPENSFQKKSVWKRMITVAAGPLFNFILAFILGVIMVCIAGVNEPSVYYVSEGSAAQEAGIKVGDLITSVDGHKIDIGRDIAIYQLAYPLDSDSVTIEFVRDGQKMSVTYDPSSICYRIGITYNAADGSAVISSVTEGSPAADAGLMEGDIITGLDGNKFANGEELAAYLAEHPCDGTQMVYTIERDGETLDFTVTPVETTEYSLGFAASYNRVPATFASAISGGYKEMLYGVKSVIVSLKMLFNGQASVKDLSGPVGIVSVISSTIQETASDGALTVFLNMLSLSVLLSANLGIVNLLPLPALDGGRLLLLIVEAFTKKKLPEKVENAINAAGFILLMALMAFILFNDVTKLF